jgi:hypothetical protein
VSADKVPKKIATDAELRELKFRGYDFSPGYISATTAKLVYEIDELRDEIADLKTRLLLVERRHEEDAP